jgi:acetyl esterase/lipase
VGKPQGGEERIYKTVGDAKLSLYIFAPSVHGVGDKSPAIVFFFGGGWANGSPVQFEQQCRYFAGRGMVAITADYRVKSRHDAKVEDCVEDAKSAMRWVRAHAAELGIDPARIASGGGSAGGHLAAAVATVEGFDAAGEDISVSAKPNAMVLFNPAMMLAPMAGDAVKGADMLAKLRDQFRGDPAAVSPVHHVKSGQPPAILFFGTNDALLEGARDFERLYKEAGNRCDLKTYEGQGHGFFNFGRGDGRYYRETLREADRFLTSLGWLKGEPTVGQ